VGKINIRKIKKNEEWFELKNSNTYVAFKKFKIDFEFIARIESNTCWGYVPDPDDSKSGVTIACGFDLGQRSVKELLNTNFYKHVKGDTAAINQKLVDKLAQYAGLKGEEAFKFLKQNPLKITEEENEAITKTAKLNMLQRLTDKWQSSDPLCNFWDLPEGWQTVIYSVFYQYGDLEKRTPNFWRQALNDDFVGAVCNLLDFGDRYQTRRQAEAVVLAKEYASYTGDDLIESIKRGRND